MGCSCLPLYSISADGGWSRPGMGWVKQFSVCAYKGALSTFSAVLDGAFKHLISWSTCACHKYIKSFGLQQPKPHNISTTVHATTKSFVLVQDGEFACWYKLFNVLSTLQKWKNFDKRQVDKHKGIFTNFRYFLIIWDIDINRKCSWFWVEWYN